ncbi:hypothetical protein [Psychrobacillus sp. OK032]|nr:hypothetical protein [Psychrobacillus sp. OK032]
MKQSYPLVVLTFISKKVMKTTFFEFAVEDFKSTKKSLLDNNCTITEEIF